MWHKRFILPQRREEAIDFIAGLPKEEVIEILCQPYKKRLPANLTARLKILTRELAAFGTITYEEMNSALHKLYYPKRDVDVGGKIVEVSIPTNELTPDEARIIESELYSLGAQIGCPLSLPQAKN